MKKLLILFCFLPTLLQAQSVLDAIFSTQNTDWYNAEFKQLEDSVSFYQQAVKLPQIPAERKLNIKNYQKHLALYRTAMHQFVAKHNKEEKAAIALLLDCFKKTDVDIDTIAATAELLKNAGKTNVYAQFLYQEIAGRRNNQVGKTFIPFSLPNEDAQLISFAATKAKYKLVLFWASWCIPCRVEMPGMLSAYHQLKNKGLAVFAVSVDENKKNWLKALSQAQLDWINLFDGKAWNTKPARDYAILKIPQNILVGPDGKIVAKNISAAGLKKLLLK